MFGSALAASVLALSIAVPGLSCEDVIVAPSKTSKGKYAKAPRLSNPVIEHDKVTLEKISIPMIFPIAGKTRFQDWFLAPRSGHRHQGQDLMAEKMTPLVACFDGTVRIKADRSGIGGNSITLIGDNGWTAYYAHVNNDTPGTNDGKGTDDYAFAPGLKTGSRVKAGEFIGYVGNSGNAEKTAPHCHFELRDQVTGAIINPYDSLLAATRVSVDHAAPKPVEEKPEPVGESVIDRLAKSAQTPAKTPKAKKAAPAAKTATFELEGEIESIDFDNNRMLIRVDSWIGSQKREGSIWIQCDSKTAISLFGLPDLAVLANEIRPGYFVKVKGSASRSRVSAQTIEVSSR